MKDTVNLLYWWDAKKAAETGTVQQRIGPDLAVSVQQLQKIGY